MPAPSGQSAHSQRLSSGSSGLRRYIPPTDVVLGTMNPSEDASSHSTGPNLTCCPFGSTISTWRTWSNMHTSEAVFSPSLSAGKAALERPSHRTDSACRPTNDVVLVPLLGVRGINCTVHFIPVFSASNSNVGRLVPRRGESARLFGQVDDPRTIRSGVRITAVHNSAGGVLLKTVHVDMQRVLLGRRPHEAVAGVLDGDLQSVLTRELNRRDDVRPNHGEE
mmetsp:Transcript_11894/g.27145  ORF Transcript_11894/g.27145 Transcript_11894/m.27145 type:complete len:222 (-) Transcript_11894:495-1160(-)